MALLEMPARFIEPARADLARGALKRRGVYRSAVRRGDAAYIEDMMERGRKSAAA